MNKKTFFAFLFVVLFILPLSVHAQGVDVLGILNRIRQLVYWVFDGLAVIIVVYAGIKYLTARGEPSKINEANKALIWAAIGVAVGLLAPFISGIINWFLVG